MAILVMFMENITCINVVIDISYNKDIQTFLVRSTPWVAGMRVPGNTPEICEDAAQQILNL